MKTEIIMQAIKKEDGHDNIDDGTMLSYPRLWSGKEMIKLILSLEPEKEQELK